MIDLDKCRDPDTGEVEAWALEIVRRLDSLTFVSPTGTGLHIWVKGTLPVDGFNKRGQGIEGYSSAHYMTFTGEVYYGKTIEERQEELGELYRKLHPRNETSGTIDTAPDVRHNLSNPELLDVGRRMEVTGETFITLYFLGYSGSDPSAADAHLMRMLAFLTGKDPERMEQLFSESALGQRDKWKNRPDYRERTIQHAIKRTRKVYDPEYASGESKARRGLRERMAYALFVHPWAQIAGDAKSAATDYFGYRVVLREAWKANKEEIDLSVRDYQMGAGLGSYKTAYASLARLEHEHGLVEKVKDGNAKDAATYRIREVSIRDHTLIDTGGQELSLTLCLSKCDPLLTPEGFYLLDTHLIRHPTPVLPERDRNGRKIANADDAPARSVGKVAAWVFDTVYAHHLLTGSPVPVSYLAKRTGTDKKNLKRRHLKDLLGCGLLEETDGGVTVPDKVGCRLRELLLATGAIKKDRRTRERIERQRRLHKVSSLHRQGQDPETIAAETGLTVEQVAVVLRPPDHAPTLEEMRETRKPSGEVCELERHAPEWDTFVPTDELQPPISLSDHSIARRTGVA
ncbi:MAG: hypothetical protein AVDCRST_MAG93-2021 [uncultured Chloroflexia bacterium]|uniref:NrS-1 polymerase-like HBD domain-containing protein n=1 Tax=uncultured Chloroflexia bacterium TaxID=1672391 RepID=A0A6J4IRA0_9CHLR|nr:MAG: hypothetical protein AVDCRST_MAG93-2021 [uncultured Chloroflexia bacterium]